MTFKKDDLVTLGKGYDLSKTSFIVLNNTFQIKYANSQAKLLLDWEQNDSWLDKAFNDMWSKLGLPDLINEGKITGVCPVKIKDTFKSWELVPALVDNQKHLFLLDKDLTKQKEFYSILEKSLQEVTGQVFPYHLSVQEYVDEIRNYLESIIRQMPGYVYWKDKNFKYLYCNELTVSQILGLKSPEDIIGKTDYDFGWDTKLVDEYRKIDEEILKTCKPKLGFEETLIREDGKTISLLVNKMPLLNNSGDPIGIVGISIDITDQKRKQELEQHKAILDEKVKVLQLFGGAIAHELRTPLAAINLEVSRMIAQDFPEMDTIRNHETMNDIKKQLLISNKVDVVKENIVDIKESVDSANRFIDFIMHNIGGLSKDVKDMDIIDISTCIQGTLKQYAFVNKAERDLLDIKIDHNFQFHGVQQLVEQVLFNLIKNSLFYLKSIKKGEIYIWTEITPKWNVLHFKDTGPGIAEQHLKSLFSEFFTKRSGGTGIGLAFCKQVMSQLEGSISCDSIEGQYTHFTLKFPLLIK